VEHINIAFLERRVSKKIIIVGGGVIGLCAAYYLQKRNHDITIIDSGDITDNCSFGNMGLLAPSDFVPLASPAAIAEGLKSLLNRASPVYIKPRLNLAFLNWALQFYKSSTRQNVEKNTPHLKNLLNLSRKLINEIRDDIGDVFEMEEIGCMQMYRSQKLYEEKLRMADTQKELGPEVERLNREELQKMEPDVELDIYGALLFKSDAHLHPGKFMIAMKDYLEKKGVAFQLNTNVKGFEKNKKTIKSVITDKGIFSADSILLSTGSWLPQLAKKLGINLPLQAGKGYSYTYDHLEKNIRYPALLMDAHCAVTPWNHTLRIGGTMEFSGINNKILINRMYNIYNSVKLFYPGLKINFPPKDKIWTGLRPVSPDGLPYIGNIENFDNLFLAGGHAMLGISQGAATGKIISDLVEKTAPEIDISAFRVERF
jgi:D-amino-acid dehydrogenase